MNQLWFSWKLSYCTPHLPIISFSIETANLHLSFKGPEGAFSSSRVPVPPTSVVASLNISVYNNKP